MLKDFKKFVKESVQESIKTHRYEEGDIIYFLSKFSILSKYNGKCKILNFMEGLGDDDWNYYEIENIENGTTLKWVLEMDLFSSEEEYKREEIKVKKEQSILKKKENEFLRREEEEKKKTKEMMKDVDPFEEEDWNPKKRYLTW